MSFSQEGKSRIMKKLLVMMVAVTLTGGKILSQNSGDLNAIQTVVPFLTIAPDSRAGGMGDAGVATSPDVYSMHWNPAKFAFIDGKGGCWNLLFTLAKKSCA